MATKIFRGDAPAVAQVTHITPTAVEIGDIFTLTINQKSISYTAAAATVGDVVAGLVAAWNASTIPEFAEITASAGSGYVILTADTPGKPFTVTASTTNTGTGNVSVTEDTKGVEPTNALQKIELVGTYTGGTFTLTIDLGSGNETTAAIAYNATAATVQAAIEGLASVTPGDVTVTGGPGPGTPWFVTFKGTYAGTDVNSFSVDGTSLTGNGSVAVTTTTQGGSLSDEIVWFVIPATGGTYTLTYGGETTAALNHNDNAATIQAALEALSTIGAGNVVAYGGKSTQTAEAYQFFLHFTGALGSTNLATPTLDDTLLVLNEPSGEFITSLVQGGQAGVDEVQLVSCGAATGGTFTLADSEATDPTGATFDYNESRSDLQTEMNTWSAPDNWYSVHITRPGHYLIQFRYDIANTNRATLTMGTGGLTGATSPGVTVLREGGSNTNEVQEIRVYGTGGTFTLTFDGQTTAATAWNAAAATLETNLEALPNITNVTVTGTGTPADPYVVEFVDPGTENVAEMTGDGALLTGGGGQVTTIDTGDAGTNEVQTVTLNGSVTGGTFTLSYAGDETAAIAYNATAGAVETALEALGTIDGVSVAGSAGGPWTVTFDSATLGATDVEMIVGDGSNLIGGSGTETLTVTLSTRNAGPNCWDTAANWNGARLPDSGDIVDIDGPVAISYGLGQLGTFTADAGTDTLTFTTAVDFQDDVIVEVSNAGGALPAGLAADTSYYVINYDHDAQTCQLSLTSGGAAVNLTDAGTGTHTAGVQLAELRRSMRHTETIGLPQRNEDSSDTYFEYRPLYLAIGCDVLTQGHGTGSGAGRFNVNLHDRQCSGIVIDTGGPAEDGIQSVLIIGTHSDNAFELVEGELGIAVYPGETATVATLTMRGGVCALGKGVSLTTLDKTAGELIADESTLSGTAKIRG